MTRRAGFSLVELLVVIFIIGLLAAFLLPAIQSVRENARALHCRNNLKQLALAEIAYEHDHRQYATRAEAFWSDPTWIVSLLPYLEEKTLYDEWASTVGYHKPPGTSRRPIAQIVNAAVPVLYCPSRRPATAFPTGSFTSNPRSGGWQSLYTSGSRTDYALNGGASAIPDNFSVHWPGIWERVHLPNGQRILQRVRAKDVKDGLSTTYLIGEKALSSDNYTTGDDPGDNWTIFECRRSDCVRFAKRAPSRDVRLADSCWSCHDFGSAHPTHWNAAYCDGSVHSLSYFMDFSTHGALASRDMLDRAKPAD